MCKELEDELARGCEAAKDMVAHMEAMGGAGPAARYLDALEAVALSLLRQLREQEWQPIETAPKKVGVSILTWGMTRGSYGYSEDWTGCSVSQWCGDGWASQASAPFGNRFTPTHWMPLPAPPNKEDEHA